jgi:hypothetical protein
MPMKAVLALGLCAVALGLCVITRTHEALAAGLSHVRATSQYKVKEDRGRYHPLNLLDDDPETVWCTSGETDPESEGIDIAFKRKQRIDRVAINPSTKSGRIVQSVRISDGERSVTVNVGTAPVAEVLKRALEGTTYTIRIASTARAEGNPEAPNNVACLADVLLYARDSLFGGGGGGKLRYDPKMDQLLGAWNGGEIGAPDRKLVLSLDGSWEWTYTPLLGGKPKHLAGEFRLRGDRLLMRTGEVGRWADMQFKYRRVKVDVDEMGAPAADYDLITLNKALGTDLAGDYNNARFQ